MSYYTARRDDDDIHVIICPKCRHIDLTGFDDVIPYKAEGFLLCPMQCNYCKTWFAFYREDGINEITKEQAEESFKKKRQDMQKDGKDGHGHSFYILFKSKPHMITADQYDTHMGFKIDEDGDYSDDNPSFKRWVDTMPSINQLIRYRKILSDIDFEGMEYLDKVEGKNASDIAKFGFKKE